MTRENVLRVCFSVLLIALAYALLGKHIANIILVAVILGFLGLVGMAFFFKVVSAICKFLDLHPIAFIAVVWLIIFIPSLIYGNKLMLLVSVAFLILAIVSAIFGSSSSQNVDKHRIYSAASPNRFLNAAMMYLVASRFGGHHDMDVGYDDPSYDGYDADFDYPPPPPDSCDFDDPS